MHDLCRALIFVRNSAWTLRAVMNDLLCEEHIVATHEVQLHMRDVYDHT